MFGGAMAGLGGAYLSLSYTPMWIENMTAGRGWIALALVVFATWRPGRVMLGAYLFGGVTMLQLHGQGIGIAEAAYQHALAYALDRKQGKTSRPDGTGTIVDHADVRRMLMTMKAETFAARAIALCCAKAIDMTNATGQAEWKARAAFLTPIAKAFGTDTGMALEFER